VYRRLIRNYIEEGEGDQSEAGKRMDGIIRGYLIEKRSFNERCSEVRRHYMVS
jgi:hypothetical protein